MFEKIFDELVDAQKEKILKLARKIIPHITEEDLLQPNDFPSLENHPLFRYEEGVLEGILTARMAFFAWKKESKSLSKDLNFKSF